MVKKKLDEYKNAIGKLVDSRGYFHDSKTTDMSDMKNWVCVHATNYMPRRNKNGQLYIPTTGMATGYKYPRATVHFTLNQIVSSHMGGNWDAQPVVVLAPYNDVVEKNGDPQMVATEDTFFVPNPDTGLILPENTHIVRPNNDTLFTIGDKISTYKTDFFTDEEIEMILSFVGSYEQEQYQKYVNCDFTKDEIQKLFEYEDEKVRKGYEKSKDKRAFLRGLFEETRTIILTQFLREAVVRMTMEKMGYTYVDSHEDIISNKVADIALAKGIMATGSNKGHSGTLNKEFEDIGVMYLHFLRELETNDIEEIYDYMCSDYWFSQCLRNMLHNYKKLNVYPLYIDVLNRNIADIRFNADFAQKQATKYPNDVYYQKEATQSKEKLAYADKLEQDGIAAYNANLDIVLRRNAARLNQEYEKAMEKLKQNPEYPLLEKMLTDLIKNGKKWHKTPDGWQPEPDIKDIFPYPPQKFKTRGLDM